MKVKTLLSTMQYTVDEVELYSNNWELIGKMSQDTMKNEFGNNTVFRFWIYVSAEGLTTLEIILK